MKHCVRKEQFRRKGAKESIKDDEEDGLKEKWPAVLALLSPKSSRKASGERQGISPLSLSLSHNGKDFS